MNLRTGRPGPLPPPVAGYEETLGPAERQMLERTLACTVVGSPSTVRNGLARFVETVDADEIIVAGHIFDHRARVRSYEILADAVGEIRAAA